jgi:hypothetical protein
MKYPYNHSSSWAAICQEQLKEQNKLKLNLNKILNRNNSIFNKAIDTTVPRSHLNLDSDTDTNQSI